MVRQVRRCVCVNVHLRLLARVDAGRTLNTDDITVAL